VSFFNVNLTEASSLIAALPRFIESEFKISATSFCRTIFIESAKAGKWNPETRVFLSQEDLAMDAMLEQIVELADAPAAAQVVISSDHQRAMTMTEDDANTLATNLKDRSPAPLDTNEDDDMSALTRLKLTALLMKELRQYRNSKWTSKIRNMPSWRNRSQPLWLRLPRLQLQIL